MTKINLKAMRMNWRRFEALASFSSGLITDPDYLQIVPLMNEIMDVSTMIDSFKNQMQSISYLRELYYFLPEIKNHVYVVLESLDGDAIRNLECLGNIIEVFSDNASPSWPEEVKILNLTE